MSYKVSHIALHQSKYITKRYMSSSNNVSRSIGKTIKALKSSPNPMIRLMEAEKTVSSWTGGAIGFFIGWFVFAPSKK